MSVTRQDLRRLFLALGEQARASASDQGNPYISSHFHEQFNSIARVANQESSVEIPFLPTAATSYRFHQVVGAAALAADVLDAKPVAAMGAEQQDAQGGAEGTAQMTQWHRSGDATTKVVKPRVFIGCSVEGLRYAKLIQLQLEHNTYTTIWHQGVFGLSKGTLETLVAEKERYDYAILVLTPDDLRLKRDEQGRVARDNVIFELGLFMGALGRERVFMVTQKGVDLPTDLAGITPAQFEPGEDANLVAALGPVTTRLEIEMNLL